MFRLAGYSAPFKKVRTVQQLSVIPKPCCSHTEHLITFSFKFSKDFGLILIKLTADL